ncbi:MAG: ABC-2 transporter permease [Lachnospiraceae bacterium]|nr:ABC-2 transporter permease [Lachnospiraceae bacterium]
MIGLLIKDIKLMKNQIVFFLITIVCGLILIPKQPLIGAWLLTFVIANFAIGSMTYDDFDNGNAFLFTLPFTRKQYANEKYLFSLAMGSLVWILLFLYNVIYQAIVNKRVDIYEVLFLESVVIIFTLLMLSVMFPIQFKYGGEKGRIANIAIIGVGLIIIFTVGNIVSIDSVTMKITEMMNELSISVLFILIAVAAYFVSMLFSQKIISQKEF